MREVVVAFDLDPTVVPPFLCRPPDVVAELRHGGQEQGLGHVPVRVRSEVELLVAAQAVTRAMGTLLCSEDQIQRQLRKEAGGVDEEHERRVVVGAFSVFEHGHVLPLRAEVQIVFCCEEQMSESFRRGCLRERRLHPCR